jgi:hypothetical protein
LGFFCGKIEPTIHWQERERQLGYDTANSHGAPTGPLRAGSSRLHFSFFARLWCLLAQVLLHSIELASPGAALQILAMPRGIAAVCALRAGYQFNLCADADLCK